jgi:glycosyltransferase involved in cell wall biosynthesis
MNISAHYCGQNKMNQNITIGIDASRVNVEEKTGVEIYSYNIIKDILKIGKEKFLIYARKPLPPEFPQKDNIKTKVLNSAHLWTQYGLSKEMIFHKSPNVTFIPSHVIPIISKGKFVVTIHDLAFLKFPNLYSKKETFYQNLAVKTAVKKASAIIVPSAITKNDLLDNFKFPADKIFVIHHGIDHNRFNLVENNEPLPFNIKRPYILFTGRIESKKNIIILLKAYALLRQESKTKHQLVLIGKPGQDYDLIQKEINNLPPNIKNDIIETGYVHDRTYTRILKNADFFVFPSIYEGFGLPIIEAMACGIPVIASNSSSIKEVAGEAGILVDTKKPLPLAAALSKLISFPQERAALIKDGLKRASEFTWQDSAGKTLKVLEDIGYKK